MERGRSKKIDAVDLPVGGVMRDVWLNFGKTFPCGACPKVLRKVTPTETCPPHVNLPRLFPLSQLID
jgi:hypothetical protein